MILLPVLAFTLHMRHTGRLIFTISLAIFLLSFQLRWLLHSALFCVSHRAMRIEREQLIIHQPFLYHQKNLWDCSYLQKKWRSGRVLWKGWVGIHPILHKYQCFPFKVQSLTCSLGELGMFLLLLSLTVMLLLLNAIQRCFSLSWSRPNEGWGTTLKVKTYLLFF